MQRRSRQRDAILAYIRSVTTHPTADTIYQAVRQQIPNISLGTVYRNLTDLVEDGQIKCVAVTDGESRYDATETEHQHFVCNKCGKVIDIESTAAAKAVLREVSETLGVSADCIAVSGMCEECLHADDNIFPEEQK